MLLLKPNSRRLEIFCKYYLNLTNEMILGFLSDSSLLHPSVTHPPSKHQTSARRTDFISSRDTVHFDSLWMALLPCDEKSYLKLLSHILKTLSFLICKSDDKYSGRQIQCKSWCKLHPIIVLLFHFYYQDAIPSKAEIVQLQFRCIQGFLKRNTSCRYQSGNFRLHLLDVLL